MLFFARIRNRLAQVPERHWRWWAVGAIAVVALSQFGRVIAEPQGDFHLHWQFGGRLAAGEYPYADSGLDLPYLPFWGVVHAPLSFLPMHLAQIAILPIFGIAAYCLFRTLSRLSSRLLPVDEHQAFWATIFTVLLASRFLVRDILECGVNLALVALAWGACWCWWNRRDWLGGSLLGFAIALKLTPALFLAWFAWKRQWKIVFATTLVTGLLLLSPILFLGRAMFVDVHRVWWHHASKGLLAENPVHGVLGEESIQNMSLRPAVARFLIHLPEGHNARYEHPWAVQFLDLPAQSAGWVVKLLTGLVVLAVAWQFREPIQGRRDPAILWEAAAVSVMILLLSPLTWGQHCVGVIPALYLILRDVFHRREFPKATAFVFGAYCVLILVLNRGLVGKEGTYLLDSYYTTTWCLAALLWLVLRTHRKEQSTAWEPSILRLPQHQPALRNAA